MAVLERIRKILNQIMIGLAGVLLTIMILMTCANIFSRLVWVPIKGTFELMGYFGAVITAFALGYTQMEKGHISVDILVKIFPDRIRKVLNFANNSICTVFFIVAGWQIGKYGMTLMQTGEVTETLRIVYYPFVFGVALGCGVLALTLMVDLLKIFAGTKEEG